MLNPISCKIFLIAVFVMSIAVSGCADEIKLDSKMNQNEAEATWEEYHQRILSRRISEATQLFAKLRQSAESNESSFLVDFRHFSSNKSGALKLKEQLSENYDITISKAPQNDYWLIDGTTRPDAISLSEEDCLSWVEFMVSVAQSHDCVFSTWSITDTKGTLWQSKDFESETD